MKSCINSRLERVKPGQRNRIDNRRWKYGRMYIRHVPEISRANGAGCFAYRSQTIVLWLCCTWIKSIREMRWEFLQLKVKDLLIILGDEPFFLLLAYLPPPLPFLFAETAPRSSATNVDPHHRAHHHHHFQYRSQESSTMHALLCFALLSFLKGKR